MSVMAQSVEMNSEQNKPSQIPFSEPDRTEVKVIFEKDAFETVKRLASLTSTDPGDVLRDAISLYEWAISERQKGNYIATVSNGKVVGRAAFTRDQGEVDGPNSHSLSFSWQRQPPNLRRVTL